MALDFASHLSLRAKLASDKQPWRQLYEGAYQYAIPYRRGVQFRNPGQALAAEIFDITAPIGVMRFAGQLHQDLFPPGQPSFQLQPGAIASRALLAQGEKGKAELQIYRRELESLSDEIQPHMMTGEFDGAIAEMCADLAAGTGCLLPSPSEPGDTAQFVRFTCLPFDDVMFVPGPFGDVAGMCWTTRQTYDAILRQFPDAQFPEAFRDAAKKAPYEEVPFYQDFIKGKDHRWHFCVHVDGCTAPVFSEVYFSKPFASPRYFKVPGEVYGRGPLLMSLGAIRTLNRVVELDLKAAALNMLGIWAYRPSSGANPNTYPLRPGAFWPVNSTGGVMGPDVARVDTGGREMQAGKIIMEELRTQIRAALHDDSIPASGATPKSATEIMALQARIKTNYLGAFGRLVHETTPDLVPRVMEILKNKRVLSSDISVDHFLTRVSVTSPLGNALRAEALRGIFDYLQVVGQVEGPQAVHRRLKLNEMMDQIGIDMGIAAKYIRTMSELKTYDEQASAKAAQAALMESAVNDPKGMAEAAQIATGEDEQGKPNIRLVA